MTAVPDSVTDVVGAEADVEVALRVTVARVELEMPAVIPVSDSVLSVCEGLLGDVVVTDESVVEGVVGPSCL